MAAKRDETLMPKAIREKRAAGLVNKAGGPFGAVVAKNGEIVAMQVTALSEILTRAPILR
tara:strand:- start:964 stop:1143 length:180 start_codon:yes stop_codon:yes gene_type:complete